MWPREFKRSDDLYSPAECRITRQLVSLPHTGRGEDEAEASPVCLPFCACDDCVRNRLGTLHAKTHVCVVVANRISVTHK
jgi:hypothetical protein